MIFDAHLHIIAPGFELIPNHGYVPPWFTTADYVPIAQLLGITGGAVVSGSFQGYDQTYLREALLRLGPAFVGVTQLPRDVSDETILELAGCGVRAVRFNLRRGGSGERGRDGGDGAAGLRAGAVAHRDLCRRAGVGAAGAHAELFAADRHRPSRTFGAGIFPRC